MCIGEILKYNANELYLNCMIPVPVYQRRNQMNASSNYEIVHGIIKVARKNSILKLHVPGMESNFGGYPIMIDFSKGSHNLCSFYEEHFSR